MDLLYGSPIGLLIYMAAWAIIEIEIEGRRGWSEGTETWYRFTGTPARIYMVFTGGKPLTGYHLAMNVINITAFWYWTRSLGTTLTAWILFAVIEDFLWFVLNPRFGIKNFGRKKVWWHSRSYWVLGWFPLDYLVGIAVSTAVSAATLWPTSGLGNSLLTHIAFLAKLLMGVGLITALSPIYRGWRERMGERDERGLIPRYFPTRSND